MRRHAATLCALLLGACAASVPPRQEPPNILYVMIDDLGWMDLACQGNARLETPNIDRLAREGTRFTDAYAAAPVCSPTRAAAVTGLAPARLGITNHIPDSPRFTPKDALLAPAKCEDHLALEYVTIAERLHEAGYRTGHIGKWHLCGDWTPRDGGKGDERYLPDRQGFDVNIAGCARGGPTTYFDPYDIHALPDRRPGEYLPDRLADEAIAFIESAHQRGPFYLQLWTYTVHWPMEAPAGLVEKYRTRTGPGLKDARYGAMIEALDSALGRVFACLDRLGIRDDTLVVFTSDNGGFTGVADNRPLRAGKGYLYEGGIRVPMIVRWPGVVRSGCVSSEPVMTTDLYPTFLGVAGLAVDPSDPLEGVDLMPSLRGTGSCAARSLFFHYPNYAFHQGNRLGSAVRTGNYKAILDYDDGSTELYDLSIDIGEEHDLAAQMPDRARTMRAALEDWLKRSGARQPTRRTE